MRKLSYPGTDVFLLCFGIDDHKSLKNIQEKWMIEISEFEPAPWVVVVGTKEDLPEGARDQAVSWDAAEELCERLNVCALMVTSAKKRRGIDELVAVVTRLLFKRANGEARPGWGDLTDEFDFIVPTKAQQAARKKVKAQLDADLDNVRAKVADSSARPATVPARQPAHSRKNVKDRDNDGSCTIS